MTTSPSEDLKGLEQAIRKILTQGLPEPVPVQDALADSVQGYGLTTFGFNQVTLNGIVTGAEFRSIETRDGFVDHVKVWVAVPALVPVVFKGSPAEAIVRNLDAPAATLGVPGITHLQRVAVVISGRSATKRWYPLLTRGKVVWVSGQLVPLAPFEPGETSLAVLATQIQVSATEVKWDRSRGVVPWSKTFTDAFYERLAKLKLGKTRKRPSGAKLSRREIRELKDKRSAEKEEARRRAGLQYTTTGEQAPRAK